MKQCLTVPAFFFTDVLSETSIIIIIRKSNETESTNNEIADFLEKSLVILSLFKTIKLIASNIDYHQIIF